MVIGGKYSVIQKRTGLHYDVEILRALDDDRFVGLTLNDSTQWSAGAEIAINNEDLVMPA